MIEADLDVDRSVMVINLNNKLNLTNYNFMLRSGIGYSEYRTCFYVGVILICQSSSTISTLI